MEAGKDSERRGAKRGSEVVDAIVKAKETQDSHKLHRGDGGTASVPDWNGMPPELLDIIFAHLDGWAVMNCSLVSKRWKGVATVGRLWAKIIDRELGGGDGICPRHHSMLERWGHGGRVYARLQRHLRPYRCCGECKTPRLEKTGDLDVDIATYNRVDLWRILDAVGVKGMGVFR